MCSGQIPTLSDGGEEWMRDRSLTGMNVRSYVEIDALNPIFDGNRAWRHLQANLGMSVEPLAEVEPSLREAFARWVVKVDPAIQVDTKGAVLIRPPSWY